MCYILHIYVKTLATAGVRLDTIGPFSRLSTNCPANAGTLLEHPGRKHAGNRTVDLGMELASTLLRISKLCFKDPKGLLASVIHGLLPI